MSDPIPPFYADLHQLAVVVGLLHQVTRERAGDPTSPHAQQAAARALDAYDRWTAGQLLLLDAAHHPPVDAAWWHLITQVRELIGVACDATTLLAVWDRHGPDHDRTQRARQQVRDALASWRATWGPQPPGGSDG